MNRGRLSQIAEKIMRLCDLCGGQEAQPYSAWFTCEEAPRRPNEITYVNGHWDLCGDCAVRVAREMKTLMKTIQEWKAGAPAVVEVPQ